MTTLDDIRRKYPAMLTEEQCRFWQPAFDGVKDGWIYTLGLKYDATTIVYEDHPCVVATMVNLDAWLILGEKITARVLAEVSSAKLFTCHRDCFVDAISFTNPQGITIEKGRDLGTYIAGNYWRFTFAFEIRE